MTSSPYKSKVLNFVVAKYNQILTRSDRTLCHLKFIATITVQLLLYPIYVLLQTSRVALKKLQQTTKSYLPEIKEKVNKNYQTNDKSIEEVSVFSRPVDSRLLYPLNPNKTLVKKQGKVTSRLEILNNYKVSDILTRAKQENPLILDTGKIEEKPLLQLQIQPCAELVPTFGVLGGVWQLMAWVQTSEIALWFNFFDESNIVLQQNELKDNNRSLNSYHNQVLLSNSNITFGEFINNLAKHYLYPITKGLGLNGLLLPLRREGECEVESLLETEIDPENQKHLLATQDGTPIVASLISPFEQGIFQIATSSTTKPLMNPEDVEKPGKKKSFPLHKHLCYEIISSPNDYLKQEAIASKEALREIDGHRVENEDNYSINSNKISVKTYNSESKPKEKLNCLEVESVSVGYIKHPLEVILGWVDVIMTWVEKIFVQAWQLCQQKLKNF